MPTTTSRLPVARPSHAWNAANTKLPSGAPIASAARRNADSRSPSMRSSRRAALVLRTAGRVRVARSIAGAPAANRCSQ